jgi:hypothetical protein
MIDDFLTLLLTALQGAVLNNLPPAECPLDGLL